MALIIVTSFTATYFLKKSDVLNSAVEVKKIAYALPSEIRYFSLGYKEVIADSLWLRFLQDYGTCEQKMAPVGAPRVGIGHIADCDKGWAYHVLDSVLECAPKWRLPAAIGPILLSVVVDDINGASLLFKKAVKNFPNDWVVLFRAGYHFLYETDEHLLAAQYYDRAGKAGAPLWVHSLAAKLYSEQGRDQVALIVLKDALVRTPPGTIRDKIQSRLVEVEKKISEHKTKSNE